MPRQVKRNTLGGMASDLSSSMILRIVHGLLGALLGVLGGIFVGLGVWYAGWLHWADVAIGAGVIGFVLGFAGGERALRWIYLLWGP